MVLQISRSTLSSEQQWFPSFLQRRTVFTAAQLAERHALLKTIYKPSYSIDKDTPEYYKLASSGKVWHDWFRYDDSVKKGYLKAQYSLKEELQDLDNILSTMNKTLSRYNMAHWQQAVFSSSKQSCAIEMRTIKDTSWPTLGSYLSENVLSGIGSISAKELISKSFDIPNDLLPGEDRNVVQEIANHITVNTWVFGGHLDAESDVTRPSLTMEDLRHLNEFQLRNTESAMVFDSGFGPRTRLGDNRLVPIQVASDHLVVFPYPQEIEANLGRFFSWLAQADHDDTLHPLVLAVQAMVYFVNIHPFRDGNGRISRMILQNHAFRRGIGPMILQEPLSRKAYLAKINAASKGAPEELIKAYISAAIRRMEVFT